MFIMVRMQVAMLDRHRKMLQDKGTATEGRTYLLNMIGGMNSTGVWTFFASILLKGDAVMEKNANSLIRAPHLVVLKRSLMMVGGAMVHL